MPSWMHKLGRCLALAAFMMLCNGHLAVLQTIAWTDMLVHNSEQNSLSVAVSETFDGQHPCALCKQIAKSEQSTKKSPSAPFSVLKLILFCESNDSKLAGIDPLETAPILDLATISRKASPLLQPPRTTRA